MREITARHSMIGRHCTCGCTALHGRQQEQEAKPHAVHVFRETEHAKLRTDQRRPRMLELLHLCMRALRWREPCWRE